jgi:hypothetical protein|tara:strand:- start:2174 stop:2617 length:444 start_codon:yes stop_codon:yes gene_type:complete
MAKIGTFIHCDLDKATGNKAVGTAYNAANFHTVKLNQPSIFGDQFVGHLGAIAIRLNTLNGTSATPKLTFRISADAAGDKPLIPDTEADITKGIGTATLGYVCAAVDLDFIFGGNGFSEVIDRQVYIHCLIDQGTCNQAETYITWRE